MDTSSELIHGLLPVFLVVTLGASATALGVVEGIAEATAQITRVFSGWLSDVLGRRKALTVAGYGLAAMTKPLFPLANSIGLVLLARFLDRIGKGIRGAPRDALIADLTPADQRGAAFGLAPVARHGRRDARAGGGDRPDVSVQRRHPHRALVRRDPRGAGRARARVRASRSRAPKEAKTQAPLRAKEHRQARLRLLARGRAPAPIFTLARFSEAFLVIRAHR